jgi:hypothetical protein
MVDLIWYSPEEPSNEHFTGGRHGDGQRLQGVVVVPVAGRPAHISYRVDADAGWRTRTVQADIEVAHRPSRLELGGDGQGTWTSNGQPAPELSGCVDVDLGWTPATNTLPIKRLGLGIGEERTLDVAWLRFPDLVLERARQTYRRLDEREWLYSSGEFSAVLEVDADGYVRRYGDDLWSTVAVFDGHR